MPQQLGLQRTHGLSQMKALVSKLQGGKSECHFCFSIDGLDEHHGAEKDITQLVLYIQSYHYMVSILG